MKRETEPTSLKQLEKALRACSESEPIIDECECDCIFKEDGYCGDCMSNMMKCVADAMKALMRFKEYFDELYGQGLEVANWHQNGATEPFDSFYDSALEYMEGGL